MPELPEVETIVRGLAPRLRGRRVESVWWSGQALHLRRKVDLAGLRAVAAGHAITGVRRLGKFILVAVDGKPDTGVVIHLGMTGRLSVEAAGQARARHTHVAFRLGGGDELRFADARRFGWVEPGRPFSASAALARVGPDPLTGLDAAALAAALDGVRAPIKAFLMDQRRVAGLGNIYVAEALHRAGIHPAARAGRVRTRAAELLAAIQAVLAGGIQRRGTTLRDYVDVDGRSGDNAAALQVYGRAGEPCPRCGARIKRRVDGGRATFFCAACQKR
ncbi:MAG TPA: bifunctional DNA-formamidopyrimidine glycosylase/DNA-(apurinic or apyrimidinic site) lyase [Polyangia bacterium]|jgi:formamidopyrimidine-DNA glycosylase|nr:bifunctional DNA-formamidopyrimidine glycosylase/DNA-(apurinic or apyrimidinic site) lyase [Polyangia bacterium]